MKNDVKNKKMTYEDIQNLELLIKRIDPENKVFNSTQELIKENKQKLMKKNMMKKNIDNKS